MYKLKFLLSVLLCLYVGSLSSQEEPPFQKSWYECKQKIKLFPDTTGTNKKNAKNYTALELIINDKLGFELSFTREVQVHKEHIIVKEEMPSQNHLGANFKGSQTFVLNTKMGYGILKYPNNDTLQNVKLDVQEYFDTGNQKKIFCFDSCYEACSKDGRSTIFYTLNLNHLKNAKTARGLACIVEYSDIDGNSYTITKIEESKRIPQLFIEETSIDLTRKKRKNKSRSLSQYLGKIRLAF